MKAWVLLVGLAVAMTSFGAEYRVAVNSVVITPEDAMWAGGYAARSEPVSEKVHDLWAKALVIEDGSGGRLVLITTDLIGITADIEAHVANALKDRFDLPRDRLVITCSHTHCGPALAGVMSKITYPVEGEEYGKIERYTEGLKAKLVSLVADVWDELEAANLAYGIGEATFAVNRRNNAEADVVKPDYEIKGPFDHDVPVLRVSDPDGALRAVFFLYACHCTTMSFQKWCGDYAGFAQAYFEADHPDATALFAAGCGGDINPIPRRDLELCKQYGRRLADAVSGTIDDDMTVLSGPIAAAITRVDLEFAHTPTREELEAAKAGDNPYYARRAEIFLERLDAGEAIHSEYAYPIQVVRIGDNFTGVFLGGEVVVDYALRIKERLGDTTAVAGYSNDVMAYIPSERVLEEGGYEGGGSMVYYGQPSPWKPGLEGKILSAVSELAQVTSK